MPLEDKDAFFSDSRNIAAAESYLRRCLEALLDLGRHISAKGYAVPAPEYKEIPRQLSSAGVLDENNASKMRNMAGYRNRLVNFYHEIEADELFDINTNKRKDIDSVMQAIRSWLSSNPEMMDKICNCKGIDK